LFETAAATDVIPSNILTGVGAFSAVPSPTRRNDELLSRGRGGMSRARHEYHGGPPPKMN
jgi:hypothetical protein